ncbi:MAG: Arc family DNA binding domain-containing protein [Gammaproteobacteria bacterium]|nr:Arc family DNA binding domain-containing protein [Gammaproteobacteria bacterium]
MAVRKSFALRIDAKTLAAMQRWAKDDLRSLNAQIEFVLRDSLRQAGRLREPENDQDDDSTE